jgi:hypothetical protein
MEKSSDQAGFSPRRGREALLSRPGLERGESRVLVTIQQTEYQVKKCRSKITTAKFRSAPIRTLNYLSINRYCMRRISSDSKRHIRCCFPFCGLGPLCDCWRVVNFLRFLDTGISHARSPLARLGSQSWSKSRREYMRWRTHVIFFGKVTLFCRFATANPSAFRF